MTKRLYHCQPLHALYDLGAASEELRSDREFVLQLVRENGRILQYATKMKTTLPPYHIGSRRNSAFMKPLSSFSAGVSVVDQHAIHPSRRSSLP